MIPLKISKAEVVLKTKFLALKAKVRFLTTLENGEISAMQY